MVILAENILAIAIVVLSVINWLLVLLRAIPVTIKWMGVMESVIIIISMIIICSSIAIIIIAMVDHPNSYIDWSESLLNSGTIAAIAVFAPFIGGFPMNFVFEDGHPNLFWA